LCAGWVAGRLPLVARLGGSPAPVRVIRRTPAAAWPPAGRLARWRGVEPAPALGAALVVVLALTAAWAAYQPVRAAHADDAAYDRLDQGQPAAAADVAR